MSEQHSGDTAADPPMDLVTLGRVSVDLYGQQIGTPLEDVATFARAVGGCPANIAIGAARLGLKSALISRVGDEPMGRFVREQLAREGVDTRGLHTDRQRLTSLVLLSVRGEHSFPLIFYRENCADSALCEDDVDVALIAAARAILVTGSHFSMAGGAQAQFKAMRIARTHGRKVILDVDYRPNLWGLGGHGAGESRYARSAHVTQALGPVLPQCDLIVGTEEEMHIAAGCEETLAALRRIRAVSPAVIVCKRGPLGCVIFDGPIPARLEQGLVAAAREVEVYNVLGAGDAFLAGFLSGYLRGASLELCAQRANACGAIAVSRLLCSVEFPTAPELNHYLTHGSRRRALREDEELNHIHFATTRREAPENLAVVALDGACGDAGTVPQERREQVDVLIIAGLARAAQQDGGLGVIFGARTGAAALQAAGAAHLWRARSVARHDAHAPGWTAHGVDAQILQWPSGVTVRCRYRADGLPAAQQLLEGALLQLAAAVRAQGRELLVAICPGAPGDAHDETVARALTRIYELGVRPDWWELPAQADAAAWERCAAAIARHDELCRGILVRRDATSELSRSLTLAAHCHGVRGFAAGRTIFAPVVHSWLAGELQDEAATDKIAGEFRSLLKVWSDARASITLSAKER
jgi:5-dehydro-2-deoxygluconokinase